MFCAPKRGDSMSKFLLRCAEIVTSDTEVLSQVEDLR